MARSAAAVSRFDVPVHLSFAARLQLCHWLHEGIQQRVTLGKGFVPSAGTAHDGLNMLHVGSMTAA